MAFGKTFLNWKEPFLMEGNGCGDQIGELLKVKGFRKILIVSGPHISVSGLLDPTYQGLEAHQVEYVLFNRVRRDPDTACIREGYRAYVENGCEAILAIGGGSPMDCAKAIGAMDARKGKDILEMAGLFKVSRKTPYFVAVPTTAGTGSEGTMAAVITDETQHRKLTIIDPFLKPDAAVLDASLTKGLPKHITAETGMDALTHAVEAYINRFSGPTDRYALEAVRLIMENLTDVYDAPDHDAARSSMLKGSYYAGIAFTRSFVGYVHAIAHAVGGIYHVSHGLANAVILPHVLSCFGDAVTGSLAELADAAGIGGVSEKEKAEGFIVKIREMNRYMEIPEVLDMISDEDIPTIIRWAMEEANPLYPVPVIWNEEQFMDCIFKISGRREQK